MNKKSRPPQMEILQAVEIRNGDGRRVILVIKSGEAEDDLFT